MPSKYSHNRAYEAYIRLRLFPIDINARISKDIGCQILNISTFTYGIFHVNETFNQIISYFIGFNIYFFRILRSVQSPELKKILNYG